MLRAGPLGRRPFQPQQQTLALLKPFSDGPQNEVWLSSGFPVEGVLHKIVVGVGVVAENGCFIKTRETQGDTPDVDQRGGRPEPHVERALYRTT